MDQIGLRERKKRKTRDQLVDTARQLFADRGFEAVTVADIATAAEVAESTVFNYFGTKEDLFFDGLEAFEEQLIGAVRERSPGVSVLEAFRDLVVQGATDLASAKRLEAAAMAARLIWESPSLRRKELEIVAGYANILAELLADESGPAESGIESHVVAHSLMATHRVLVEHVRALALEDVSPDEVAALVTREADRAFNALGDGIADFGRR